MVYFHSKNPNFYAFGKASYVVGNFGTFYDSVVFLIVIWYRYFCDHLVYFVVFWCMFPVLVSCAKKNLATLTSNPLKANIQKIVPAAN
jgi:hypothetical protein